MHDGSVATGDRWVRDHLGGYARWAKRHDSLLLVTFDEDDYAADNHIATIAYGARVRSGSQRSTRIDHCRVLRTLEALYGLAPIGCAAGTPPINVDVAPLTEPPARARPPSSSAIGRARVEAPSERSERGRRARRGGATLRDVRREHPCARGNTAQTFLA